MRSKSLHWFSALVVCGPFFCSVIKAGNPHYIGPESCALCHKEIAAKQEKTAMATTWQGKLTPWLPKPFVASAMDGLLAGFKSSDGGYAYSVKLSDQRSLSAPVQAILGARRHGLGFLVPIQEIDGLPLARRTLVQARYAWSPERHKLLLAPGCPSGKPQSVEAALGVALSPTFESRCLECHGEPKADTGPRGGVRCESCHGPGSEHIIALGRAERGTGIVNPKRLSNEESIGVCSRCHVGLTRFADPSGDDLLIANQVRAITTSECYLQSRKAFSCVACHDPHSDAVDDGQSIATCLGCHSDRTYSHAAICPVNAKNGCTGCHMPSVELGPLHLVDHLIRVHPEQQTPVPEHGDRLRSRVRPVSAYLRIIVTNTPEAAANAKKRLDQGEAFYPVAREISLDPTASIGGYLGRKNLSDLSEALRENAARLNYGETSSIVQSDGKWAILQRLPRDFRWNAEQLERQAEDLGARGEAAAAIEKAQQALMIYPHFLRALNFIGMTFATSGNPQKGADVLRIASKLYPEDAGTRYSLAPLLLQLGDSAKAKDSYEQAIKLEPDFTAAYANLGMLSYEKGDWRSAANTFRQGLQIDPLSAELNYDLGLALRLAGDDAGATQAMSLANSLRLAAPSVGSNNPAQ